MAAVQIGYVTPKTKLEGREQEVLAERDRKLEDARKRRAETRTHAKAESDACAKEAVPA